MNILILSYIMNVYCVRLKGIIIYIYIYIIEWKMVEIPKKKYQMIFNNTLNFKAQLITCI